MNNEKLKKEEILKKEKELQQEAEREAILMKADEKQALAIDFRYEQIFLYLLFEECLYINNYLQFQQVFLFHYPDYLPLQDKVHILALCQASFLLLKWSCSEQFPYSLLEIKRRFFFARLMPLTYCFAIRMMKNLR